MAWSAMLFSKKSFASWANCSFVMMEESPFPALSVNIVMVVGEFSQFLFHCKNIAEQDKKQMSLLKEVYFLPLHYLLRYKKKNMGKREIKYPIQYFPGCISVNEKPIETDCEIKIKRTRVRRNPSCIVVIAPGS